MPFLKLPRPLALRLGLVVCLLLSQACTISHSKQALWAPTEPVPRPTARFVSEEDSGIAIFGYFQLSEPDHYAVLMERARKRHRCSRLLQAQLDFYTDHWLLVSFPIARVTLLCESHTETTPARPATGPQ